MEYQKIINLLDNVLNQPSIFRSKNWVEINGGSHGTYNTDNPIKSKTSMIRSSLYDYCDEYIIAKETITVEKTGTVAAPNNRNKNVIFKNCAPFTECICGINIKKQITLKKMDVVMPIYNLIKYSDNYSKTSGSLWQYYRDEPFIDNNGNIIDIPDGPDSASFK